MLVRIPDRVGYLLQERAAALGLDVDVMLAASMEALGTAPVTGVTHVHRVVGALVDQGLCDADIAAATHYTVGWVAQVRRDLGKPPNRRYTRATSIGNPD